VGFSIAAFYSFFPYFSFCGAIWGENAEYFKQICENALNAEI
jgi:hypothetical protein